MSGGRYDYAYGKIQDFADSLREEGGCRGDSRFKGAASPAMRRAFAAHCKKVAAAMRAIEWNDSGDGDETETDLIQACLGETGYIEACRDQVAKTLAEAKAAVSDLDAAFASLNSQTGAPR